MAHGFFDVMENDFAAGFFERDTKFHVDVEQSHADGILDMVRTGSAEVGLLGTHPQFIHEFNFVALAHPGYHLLVPLENPLSQRSHLELTDLDGQPLVTLGKKNHLHRFFLAECEREGVRPDILIETSESVLRDKYCREVAALAFACSPKSTRPNVPTVCLPLCMRGGRGLNDGLPAALEHRSTPCAALTIKPARLVSGHPVNLSCPGVNSYREPEGGPRAPNRATLGTRRPTLQPRNLKGRSNSMELNRRDLLKGFGAAAVAAGSLGAVNAIAEEAGESITYAQFNERVKSVLRLDSNLIGVKFYESVDDVPAEAVHPKRDMDKHIATCQAFAQPRPLQRPDHLHDQRGRVVLGSPGRFWPGRLQRGHRDVRHHREIPSSIADPERAVRFYADEYPRHELEKYEAWVVGPLSAITYDPDVVMVYGDPFAINWLCLNAKHLDGKTIQSNFDGIDSCVYEMVNTMNREDYQVCFPDCGEIVRARAKQTDAVFCIPLAKLQDFMNCVFTFGEGFAFNFEVQYEYPLDYTRPPFYNEVFAQWGLDTGTDWALG